MELLTRNNFEGWMQKLMERLDEIISNFSPDSHRTCDFHRIRRSLVFKQVYKFL